MNVLVIEDQTMVRELLALACGEVLPKAKVHAAGTRAAALVSCRATPLWQAIWLITVADITMSLDNVLAVAGAAHGDIWLLIFGLVLSIPLVVFTSGWIAGLMDRYRAIIYVGAAILGWVGGGMIIGDPYVTATLQPSVWHVRLVEFLGAVLVLAIPVLLRKRVAPSV